MNTKPHAEKHEVMWALRLVIAAFSAPRPPQSQFLSLEPETLVSTYCTFPFICLPCFLIVFCRHPILDCVEIY